MFEYLITEPEEIYHAQSRSGKYMSSHLLSDFRKSPLLYRKKMLGQIENKSSVAYAIGSAAHKLILEGKDAFDKEYMIADGPVNPTTGKPYDVKSQKYQQWIASVGGKVLGTEDYGLIAKMNHAVSQNKEAKSLLSNGFAEKVVRAELEDVPCQIRMDWFNPEEGIVDLKTTQELEYFENECRRFNYIYQLAFYRAVLRKASGKTFPVRIIGVEKCEPFAAGVWVITPEVLDLAELANNAALKKVAECKKSNVWETGYERTRIIDRL
jgi:hypothetical protein